MNEEQVRRLVDLLKKHVPDLRGRRVGVLGLTYKPGVDDVRETLAYKVIKELINEGASVVAHDPVGAERSRSAYPDVAERVEFGAPRRRCWRRRMPW